MWPLGYIIRARSIRQHARANINDLRNMPVNIWRLCPRARARLKDIMRVHGASVYSGMHVCLYRFADRAIGFWRLYVRTANVHSRFEPYYSPRAISPSSPGVIDSQRLCHPSRGRERERERGAEETGAVRMIVARCMCTQVHDSRNSGILRYPFSVRVTCEKITSLVIRDSFLANK